MHSEMPSLILHILVMFCTTHLNGTYDKIIAMLGETVRSQLIKTMSWGYILMEEKCHQRKEKIFTIYFATMFERKVG